MVKKLDINPWFTMWYRPRETIRKIIEYNPKYLVIVLMMIGGFSNILDHASAKSLGDSIGLPIIFISALIIGSLFGIVSLYIYSAVLKWTGKWIGGKATSEYLRTAIAWSYVPVVWSLIFWIPQLVLYGEELFTSITPRIDSNPLPLILFGVVELIIAIWAFIVFINSLSEVQKFSVWKALLNLLLSILVLLIPLFFILFAMFYQF